VSVQIHVVEAALDNDVHTPKKTTEVTRRLSEGLEELQSQIDELTPFDSDADRVQIGGLVGEHSVLTDERERTKSGELDELLVSHVGESRHGSNRSIRRSRDE
jgi:hypothetical protein